MHAVATGDGPSRAVPVKEWVAHYNRGRCRGTLGLGVPHPPSELSFLSKSENRHRLVAGSRVLAKSTLGGLHHGYALMLPRAWA